MAEITPMMRQYLDIKKQNPDSILFFRLGDFYEMFYDDAKTASSELELVLTGKDCGLPERAPMCGVPYHSCEAYIARLVAKGHKVAICEQTEDPDTAKGVVKREVVRVITPGTVLESNMLDESKNNYLCVLCSVDASIGLCFADCSTGELYATELSGEELLTRAANELSRFCPSEILLDNSSMHNRTLVSFITERLNVTPQEADSLSEEAARQAIFNQFPNQTLAQLQLKDKHAAVSAAGTLLAYLKRTQMSGIERLSTMEVYSDVQYMQLDLSCRNNLELLENARTGEKKGSLLGVLDRTKTAMGKRLIRTWIERPLLNLTAITRRLNAVGELVSDSVKRADLIEILGRIHDMERIMTKVVYGSANARDLCALAQTFSALPAIKETLSGVSSVMLGEIANTVDPMDDVRHLIDSAIADDPPLSVREGGLIRRGFHKEIDELNIDLSDGRGIIAKVEAEEKQKTGIKNLKVGYNRVFGYYIEVSRSQTDQVPPRYIRKQTLANAERYVTEELKALEARVLGAKERAAALEYQVFQQVREKVASQLRRVQMTSSAVARLDILCSFAEVAVHRHYVCPTMDTSGEIHITAGRHPVVEALQSSPFVPNDTHLDRENRIAVITGPNMAGKSTFMRQTALIVLMAQIGSFVPAEKATIGIVDGIFTRVGAADDLASGQSTFMLEMSEVAAILQSATKNSLIVFDEIGRGTSTFDGMSIARAVLEYVADPKQVGAKTLFATHYHELTVLEQEIPGVTNYNVAVKKRGDDITFLRRIVPGPADDSYGIQVAKLAGIPTKVIARAKEVLLSLEQPENGCAFRQKSNSPSEAEEDQLSLVPLAQHDLITKLQQLDANTLTPIEALQTLSHFIEEARSL